MKSKAILTLAAVALICAVAFIFLNRKHGRGDIAADQRTVVDGVATNGSNPAAAAVGGGSSTDSTIASPALPISNNQAGEAITAVSSVQFDRPISFYGRVVDGNGTEVIGARVRMIWSHLTQPQTSYETNVLSDDNGTFSLNDVEGARLSVDVTKDGYYPAKSMNPTAFSYSQTVGGKPFQPDINSPVVFHLRKKGAGADLITSRQGMYADFPVKAPLDGTSLNVDLMVRQAGGDGQLQISQTKPEFADWKQATNWTFKMTIPGGGFVEENDEFPFEAPTSGYQPVVEFDFQRDQAGWAINVSRDYYIEFGSPPRYGHLHFETSLNTDEVRLTYAINPDGTQNLEPK